MAIVVVGGSGRGVGKTALVCGVIAALREFRWTGVKITGHAHGKAETLWEETQPGQGSDTARFLAAGAVRALLLTADKDALGPAVRALLSGGRGQALQPIRGASLKLEPHENVIVESNRILEHLSPDLCLAVRAAETEQAKPSFARVLERADAVVVRADAVAAREAARDTAGAVCAGPQFRLASLDRLSPEMLEWLRGRLGTPSSGLA